MLWLKGEEQPVSSLVTIIDDRLLDLENAAPDLRVVLHWGHPSEFPKNRDFAYCFYWEGRAHIIMAPKMEHQPAARQDGLLRHELAHALLLHRGQAHTEAECDATAERVFGAPLYYDRDDVQTTDPNAPGARRPRPSHLPRGDGTDAPRPTPASLLEITQMTNKAPLSNPIGKVFGPEVIVVRMPNGDRRHIKHPESEGTLCCPRAETAKRSYRVIPVMDQSVTVDCYRCLRLAAYNQRLRNSPVSVPPPSDRDLYASLSQKKSLVTSEGKALTNRRSKK